jgi:hypothetical protein
MGITLPPVDIIWVEHMVEVSVVGCCAELHSLSQKVTIKFQK